MTFLKDTARQGDMEFVKLLFADIDGAREMTPLKNNCLVRRQDPGLSLVVLLYYRGADPDRNIRMIPLKVAMPLK